MGRGRLLSALIVIAVFAATGAYAGRVNTLAYTGYPVDRLYAYTYRWESNGYPPSPYESIIWGADMEAASGPHSYTYYKAALETDQHIVGNSYTWKVKRYSDWDNRVLGPEIIQSTSVAQ